MLPTTETPLTTADGRTLRTIHMGDGDTVVILECGLGGSANTWGGVIDLLAPHVKVIAYDRAGYDGSDPDEHPRDLDRITDDLVQLIAATPHERLILAGHSWGGPIIRNATHKLREAGTAPDGLVLIDASDENAALYFEPSTRKQMALQSKIIVLLQRLGLLRLQVRGIAKDAPTAWRAAMIESASNLKAARATKAELAHVIAGMEYLRDTIIDDTGIPTRVLSGMDTKTPGGKLRGQLNDAHRKTAERMGGTFVPAEKSGHMIPFTEPELVAAQILDLAKSAL